MNHLIRSFFLLSLISTSLGWAASKDTKAHSRCGKSEFKSWEELTKSPTIEFEETEKELVIISECDIHLNPKFRFSTNKDLYILANSLHIKNHSALSASRLYLKGNKLHTSNHAEICADVIILVSEDAHLKAKTCKRANLLGSAVGKQSFLPVLKVKAPESTIDEVIFDWSESFGPWDEASLDLGNGTIIDLEDDKYTHRYDSAGTYSTKVTLKYESETAESNTVTFTLEEGGIKDFGIFHEISRAGPPAEIFFSLDQYPIVGPDTRIKEFRYDFGDGVQLTIPEKESPTGFVIHTYAENKEYEVILEVEDIEGNIKTVKKIINVNNPSIPVPKYKVSAYKGEAPFTVTFTGEAVDLEDGEVNYVWVFPDGEVFIGKEFKQVEKTFTTEGVHWVYMEVIDELNGIRVTHIPIYVGSYGGEKGLEPIAHIDSTSRFGQAPLKVEFRGDRSFDPDSNGTSLSYEWNFGDWESGDANFSNSPNGVHTYNKPGSYFIQLSVTDADGNINREFTQVYVDGNESDNFEFKVSSTRNPREYHFSADRLLQESDYTGSSIRWNFGDGSFELYNSNVVKQYAQDGNYLVELKLRKVDGDYISYTRNLTVNSETIAPNVAIIASNNLFMIGKPMQFLANFLQGEGSAKTVYRWDLGDGTVIKGEGEEYRNVVHTYLSSGSKVIRLTVTSESGLTAESEIWLNENRFAPQISGLVIYGDLNETAPVRIGVGPWETTVDFDGNLAEYIYDWGDGFVDRVSSNEGYKDHIYQTPGTYTLAVTAVDSYGLSSRFEQVIQIKANQSPLLMDFNLSVERKFVPALVRAEAWPFAVDSDGWIKLYEYDWGDGSIEQTMEGHLRHTYTAKGDYNIQVRVMDDKGTWSGWIMKTVTIEENVLPAPHIALLSQNIYAPTKLKFSGGLSQDPDGEILTYNWSVSDGRTFHGTEIEVDFDQPGQYSIALEVVDNNGGSGNSSLNFEVKNNNPPVASFELFKTEFKELEIIPLESLSYDIDENQVLTHVWEMSDGSSYLGTHNFHFFDTPGTHWIKLTALDESGAISQKMYYVTVLENEHLPPVAKLRTVGLEENDYELIGSIGAHSEYSYSKDGEITSIFWEMGDGNTYEDVDHISHTYQSPGIYVIRLTVTTEFGVSSTTTKEISVLSTVNPNTIDSPYEVELLGFSSSSFNPTNISFSAIVAGTDFSSQDEFQLIVENDGEFKDLTSSLQKVAPNKISGQIELPEGKNFLSFYSYDANRNRLLEEVHIIYAGNRLLEIKLSSVNGNPVPNTPVSLMLVEDKNMKAVVNSDSSGVAVFPNIPSFELEIFAQTTFGELFAERIGTGVNAIELRAIEFGQPTPQEQNDLNLGLAGWYYNPLYTDLIDTAEGKKLRMVVPPGNATVYEKSFVAEEDHYYYHKVNILEVSEGSLVEVLAFNETTGEVDYKFLNSKDFSLKAIDRLEISIFAQRNDIVHFRVQIRANADSVSFLQKFFSAYAQLSNGVVINSESVKDRDYKFKLTLQERVEDNSDGVAMFTDLTKLSVGDFNLSINNKAVSLSNKLHGDLVASLVSDSKIIELELLEVYFKQGDDSKFPSSSSVKYTLVAQGFEDKKDASSNDVYLELNTSLDSSKAVTPAALIKLTYNDRTTKKEEILGTVIPPSEFLVNHNLLNDSNHYDDKVSVSHFNLPPTKAGAWDGGDFWSHPNTVAVLDLLSQTNVQFKVGDVSNINGGAFSPHLKGHNDGLSFDAATRNYNNIDAYTGGLTHDSLNDLEALLVDHDLLIRNFSRVLAYYKPNSDVGKDLRNRCAVGRTMNEYISNTFGKTDDHKNHWHFVLTLKPEDGRIPRLSLRKDYSFSSPKITTAPNGDAEMVVSYPAFPDSTRVGFRIYRKINNEELFGSYKKSIFPTGNEAETFPFTAEFDGNRSLKLKFNIKDLGKIFNDYKFTAMAARTSDSYCTQKEILVGAIDDCNDDGQKGDLAFVTKDGGYVGIDATVQEGAVIANGARICGTSTVNSMNVTISDNNILENVLIGTNCSSLTIKNSNLLVEPNRISDSQICNKIGEFTHSSLLIDGFGINVTQGSSLDGDLSIFEDVMIVNSAISGYGSSIKNSNISRSNIRFFDTILGSIINDSSIVGDWPSEGNNYVSLRIKSALIKNNSIAIGFGTIEGTMDNGFFKGDDGFFQSNSLIGLHLYPSGSITNGGQASGCGWIAGSIRDGGSAFFSGTTYHYSGVNLGASIGQGGEAGGYSYVKAGTLYKPIWHEVFDGNRIPDTMNIDSWKAGDPWPSPLH